MKTIYGDTTGTLSKYKIGKSQRLPDYDGDSTQSYTISATPVTSPIVPVAAMII